MMHIRIWDSEMGLLYSSKTDPRTPEQFMLDESLTEVHYTEDYPPDESWRTRRAGKLIKSPDGTVKRETLHA